MSFPDFSSLNITNAGAACRDAYEHYAAQLLGYGPDLRALFTAADNNPACAMLNANAAILHLAFEGKEGWVDAAPFLKRMRLSRKDGLCEREELFCTAVEAWAAQDFYQSQSLFERIARRWPDDLVAIKWGQYHAFNLGDQAALLRLGRLAADTHENAPYVHGLLAFGLEQNHFLEEAEAEAKRAIEIAIDDGWAHHAVAHVMETQHRAADGAAWMAHCSHIWESKGTFIREHNWWHAALFHLALGNREDVYKIFDERLWGEWPEFPQEQIGATSLLWRLELHGLEAGTRWQPVVEKARERTEEHLFCFHDLHYLFAFAKAGTAHETEAHLAAIKQNAEKQNGPAALAWQKACVPTAEGIIAFTRGDFQTAAKHLSQAVPHLERIGGSHAQRAIFHETLNVAKERAARGNVVAF